MDKQHESLTEWAQAFAQRYNLSPEKTAELEQAARPYEGLSLTELLRRIVDVSDEITKIMKREMGHLTSQYQDMHTALQRRLGDNIHTDEHGQGYRPLLEKLESGEITEEQAAEAIRADSE